MIDIKTVLDDKIMYELERINDLEGQEKTEAIENIAKLYKLKLEDEKNQQDILEKRDVYENERILKKEQMKVEERNFWIKTAVDIAGITLPLILYGMWFNKGLKFEETGSYTSTTFRNFFGKIKPNK